MRLEVWSDVMCPWCYIGKRRLESALARLDEAEQVEVVWRSFELRPQHPGPPGATLSEIMARRDNMGPEAAAKLLSWIEGLGEAEGLALHLATARPVRSFDAHRLIHLAAASGLGDRMKERLLHDYLVDNADVADNDVLVAAACGIGLDADAVRAALASEAYADDVRADEARAAEIEVAAVPTFVVDGDERLTGVVTVDDLLGLLQRPRQAAQ